MRGIINLFQKRGQFKPEPNTAVELEWADPNGDDTIVVYGTIRAVHKKKLVIECSTQLPTRLGPGEKIRVCSLAPPWFQSYIANVYARERGQLEISRPTGEQLENHQIPNFTQEEKLDYATSVDYKASRSPFKQVAEVVAIGRNGLTLQTNVSIPKQTCLEIHLKLPNRSEPLPAQVKAVSSQTLSERKKFATEVEYVTIQEPELDALWDLALRHHLRVTTRASSGT